MINVISTVIAIVLTLIMAAAETGYIGSAFTTIGPKAYAMQITQAESQMLAAWTLYNTYGNTTTLAAAATLPTITGAATTTDLITTGYLSAIPTAPNAATTWGGVATAAYALDLTDPSDVKAITAAPGVAVTNSMAPNGGVFIMLPPTATATCVALALAGGMTVVANTPTTVTTPATLTAAFLGYKFGCVQIITNASLIKLNNLAGVNLAYPAGDNNKYVAYYKY